jgi:hypothetical protein
MAIKRPANYSCKPCEYSMTPGDPNGSGVVAEAFSLRTKRRTGKQLAGDELRDQDMSDMRAAPRSVGLTFPLLPLQP